MAAPKPTPLTVALAAIPPTGHHAHVGEVFRPAAEEGMGGPVGTLDGHVELVRRGPHVLARGNVDAVGEVACDRCGSPLALRVAGEFACVYSPLDSLRERGENEDDEGGPEVPEAFAGEADEVSEYSGDTIDLAQVVREFVALERPARVFCADVAPAAERAAADAACHARIAAVAPADDVPLSTSPFAALKDRTKNR